MLQGSATNLASFRCLLSELDGNGSAVCEEVPFHVKDLRPFNQRRNLWRREVRLVVFLRDTKSGDKGSEKSTSSVHSKLPIFEEN